MTPLRCRNCQYDLSGIERRGVCPECAADVQGSVRAAEEAARRPGPHPLAICSQVLSIGAGVIGFLLLLGQLDSSDATLLIGGMAFVAVMFGPFAGLWLLSFLQRRRIAASIALLIANVLLIAGAGVAYYDAIIAPTSSTAALSLLVIPAYGYPFVALMALITFVGLRRRA